jgi:hypothetical protein
MVSDIFRGVVDTNYGISLCGLKADTKALAAGERAVTFWRSLSKGLDPNICSENLPCTLNYYGNTSHDIGYLEDAARVGQEAVTLHQTLVDLGHDKHKKDLALALVNYGVTLRNLGNLEDAARVEQLGLTI